MSAVIGKSDLHKSQELIIKPALESIFKGIDQLCSAFPSRKFTIDGRLVGDIGEILAELVYDIKLDDVSQPDHDATTTDGKRVQVKATFKNSLTFKTTPELYLGIRINKDGTFEEIFNDPGVLIHDEFSERKGLGEKLLSFPLARIRLLSEKVADCDRIQRRIKS